jgi:hypothetical protein
MATEEKVKRKTIPKVVKDQSWAKWIGDDVAKAKCMCCGIHEIKMNSFHCGHVVALVNGGKSSVDNLRPICAACNLSMGTENLDDFKKRCGFDSLSSGVSVSTPQLPEPAQVTSNAVPLSVREVIAEKAKARAIEISQSKPKPLLLSIDEVNKLKQQQTMYGYSMVMPLMNAHLKK